MDPCGDESGDVGHVDHKNGAHFVGDLAERFPRNGARIGGSPGDDQLRFMLAGQGEQLVEIDGLGLFGDVIRNDVEPFAAHVQRMAVGEMTPVGQVQSHDGVAGVQNGEEDRLVGLRPGVGLDVGVLGAEEGLGPIDGELFGDVDGGATAVVTFAGIPFGVFVGQDAPLRGEDRFGGGVFGGDQFEGELFALFFALDGFPQFGIGFSQNRIGLANRHRLPYVTCRFDSVVIQARSASAILSTRR